MTQPRRLEATSPPLGIMLVDEAEVDGATGLWHSQKERQRRRLELSQIFSSPKNGVLGAFGIPDELETAFLGHLKCQTDQKRRLESIRRGGRARNGVSGALEISGGLKTPFFGHLKFPQASRRRF
jgi:hypothetical protein